MIINFKIILNIFIFLNLYYFSFINCQIIASNENITIYESNVPNHYITSYSYSNQCSFLGKYYCNDINNLEIINNQNGNSIGITQYTNYFTIKFSSIDLNNSSNIQYGFTITNLTNPTIFTEFIINVYCDLIDEEIIETKLLSNSLKLSPNYNSINYYFLIISIKGLNYTCYNVPTLFFSNIGQQFFSRVYPINKELYTIEVVFSDIIDLVDTNFNITIFNQTYYIGPIYNDSIYQTLDINNYPLDLINTTNDYSEYGFKFSPLSIVSSNVTNQYPLLCISKLMGNNYFTLLKRIGVVLNGDGNLIQYKYILPIDSIQGFSQTNYTITIQNGPNFKDIDFNIFKYNQYQLYRLGYALTASLSTSGILANFTYTTDINVPIIYRNVPYSHTLYNFNFISSFPFGFESGNLTVFNYKVSYPKKNSLTSQTGYIILCEYGSLSYISALNPNPIKESDVSPPQLNLFQFNQIKGFKYLLIIGATDNTQIAGFQLLGSYYPSEYAIVNGSVSNGIFEFIIDISNINSNSINYISIVDIYGFKINYFFDSTILIKPDGTPVIFNLPVDDIDLDIQNFTYAFNNIDISNKPFYNTIFFNSSNIPIDYPIKLRLLDDVSYDQRYPKDGLSNGFPILWDRELKLFKCDFVIPKNTNYYTIPFQIESPYRSVNSIAFPPLVVWKTHFDNDGPIITNIFNLNNEGLIGWRITILDDINGFDNGYIKAIGSIDSSIFKFNFTISNVRSGGNSIVGEYDIVLNISSTCIKQNYTIDTIYLEDSMKIYSKFYKFDINFKSERNPLRNYYNDFSNILYTESTCNNIISDLTPPELVSFGYSIKYYPNLIYTFDFIAKDDESGLMVSQRPILYFLSFNFKLLQFESTVIPMNQTHTRYTCDVEFPFMFGYPNNISYSIYGFINNGGTFSGFTNDNPLLSNLSISLDSSLEDTAVLLNYEPIYQNSNNDLIIYGKSLQKTISVKIQHSSTEKYILTSKLIGNSAIVVPFNSSDFKIVSPFNVTVRYLNSSSILVDSNTITVYPTYFNTSDNVVFSPTQSPSSTPIPTNSPQKCFGTPVCGGPTNGYCNVNTGCVCYSPFVGIDCSSQIIIVPPPKINNTNPTTEIPINDNGSNNNGTDSSSVFYKSLISLYAIRELSIDQKEINKYEFNKWLYNEIDNTTHLYYSNITTKDNKIVKITATLKWFTNETTIEFANQNLLMNPSSMKYTIEISNYQFKSKLNSLQLIMFASFDSNQTSNTCSSKQFGDTSSGDNSNYLKIQIENKSLYGRFIKRGIIDNSNIVSLSNQLLDDELNSIESSHQIQSFIGITLPYFNQNAIIDPDFSVLLDSKTADSICDNKSSKLSGTQIAGIVIGCVVFFCGVVVSVVYAIYKTQKKKEFIKNIGNKLKNMND